MKPSIPDEILDRLEYDARSPLKSETPPDMKSFWADAMELKGIVHAEKRHPTTRWAGASTVEWERIREALGAAMAARDFRYLDAFAEAWTKTARPEKVVNITISETGGETVSINAVGPPDHKRRGHQVEIILAIRQIQFLERRAPNRGEILDLLAKRGVDVDIAELSRQLKPMGIGKLLSSAKLAS